MKQFLAILLLVGSPIILLAQTTDLINYQAIVRDGDGNITKNTPITLRVSIIAGTADGSVVYEESHDVETDDNGYFYVHIGDGDTADDFGSIDWGSGLHFLKTEYDFNDGSAFLLAGLSELTSVAYANYANNYNEIDPLFNNSVAKGITQADTALWNNSITPIETDPVFTNSTAKGITEADTANWNSNKSNWANSNTGINYLDGNVGIGTSTPNNLLDIEFTSVQQSNRTAINLRNKSTDQFSTVGMIFSAGENDGFLQLSHKSSTYANNYFAGFSDIISVGKGLILGASRDGEMRFYVGNNPNNADIPLERMRILNNGNVGIGTSTPLEKLSVNGTIESTNGGIKFPDGTVQTTASKNNFSGYILFPVNQSDYTLTFADVSNGLILMVNGFFASNITLPTQANNGMELEIINDAEWTSKINIANTNMSTDLILIGHNGSVRFRYLNNKWWYMGGTN